MEFAKMSIKQFVEHFDIKDMGDEKIGIRSCIKEWKSNAEECGTRKQEVLNYFASEKATAARRKSAENNMPGLAEIRNAMADAERYARQFGRMMEDEYNDGANPPKRPEVSIDMLKKQYPQAAAFLKAESWSYASNVAKYSAGKKAVTHILDGEDYNQVIKDMQSEWDAYCSNNLWD